MQRGLCRRIAGHMRERAQALTTGNLDHAAPTCTLHLGHKFLNQADARDDIQLVIPRPLVRGPVEPGVLRIDGCVVDEDVDGAQRRARLRREARGLGLDHQIGTDEYRAPAGTRELTRESLSSLLIAAVNHHGHALSCELPGDRGSDAGGASRHQRPFFGQVEIHRRALSNHVDVECQGSQLFPQ
jgi:hypothetical protein